MTDFRARGTIMGPTGLTAVFGMGTGVTPPVWSPERRTAGGQAAPDVFRFATKTRRSDDRSRKVGPPRDAVGVRWHSVFVHRVDPHGRGIVLPEAVAGSSSPLDRAAAPVVRGGADGSGWSSDRLLELVRCDGRPPYTPSPSTWSSSRSLPGVEPVEAWSRSGLRA